MNWLRHIKERGIAFSWTWTFGKPDKGPFCGRCKKSKKKHWIERHPFEEIKGGEHE